MAQVGELVQQVGQGAAVEIGLVHIVVLFEAGERLLFAYGNGQCAEGKNPIHVNHVPYHLLYAPLARSIAEGSLSLGERGQRLIDLTR